MSFTDRAALERELEQNLRHGRAFLNQTSEVPVLSECVLVLVHPEHGTELRLSAQVVMVNPSGPMCGMGIALRSFGPNDMLRVQQFAASLEGAANDLAEPASASGTSSVRPGVTPASATSSSGVYAAEGGERKPRSIAPDFPGVSAAEGGETGRARSTTPPAVPQTMSGTAPASPAGELCELEPSAEEEPEPDESDELGAAELEALIGADDEADAELNDSQDATDAIDTDDSEDEPLGDDELTMCAQAADGVEEQELAVDENAGDSRRPIELQVGNKQEKLRNLNAAQQLKVARTGELAERIAIERLYGKHVWVALLHNPRLSLPEVARIARKGTVPKPQLDVILENNAWIKAPAVRRALLSNPKIGSEAVLKLLRLTPKHELKVLEKSTAYGAAVREAARKLLKQ